MIQEMDKPTDKQLDKQSDKLSDKLSDKQTDRQMDKQLNNPNNNHLNNQIDKQSDKQSDKQMDRQTDRQQPSFLRQYDHTRTAVHEEEGQLPIYFVSPAKGEIPAGGTFSVRVTFTPRVIGNLLHFTLLYFT